MKKPIVVLLFSCLSFAGTVQVDSTQQYQTIVGWGGVAQIGHLEFGDEYLAWQDEILDRAVNELGLNYVRLEIRAGAENPVDYFQLWITGQISYDTYRAHRHEAINDNSDPNSVNVFGFQWSGTDRTIEAVINPMRELLAARGESLFVDVLYTAGSSATGGPGLLHSEDPEEYAELLQAVFEHIESKYGWVPDQVEVVNEPNQTDKNWDWRKVASALIATDVRLEGLGYDPSFSATTNLNLRNAYTWFDRMALDVPEVLSHIDELSYHRYGGDSEPDIAQIGVRVDTYGVRSAMDERIGANHTHLHQDLTLGLAGIWQQHAIAFPGTTDNGAVYYLVNRDDPNDPYLVMGSRTKFLRQYFKYVRSGAVRVEASSDSQLEAPLAFVNIDGSYVVVVKADGPTTVNVQGVPAANYGVFYTTNSAYNVELPDGLSGYIPAAGVITFYGKKGEGESPPPPPDPGPRPDPDVTPPFIVIDGPATAQRRTTVLLVAIVSDDTGVVDVAWRGCQETEDPTVCELAVGGSPKKTYTITATAFDAAGNQSTAGVEVHATR